MSDAEIDDDRFSGGWNYRLTVQKVENEEVWAIRELYYDKHGNVTSWTEDPVPSEADSREEAENDLAYMFLAAHEPAYDLDTKQWRPR